MAFEESMELFGQKDSITNNQEKIKDNMTSRSITLLLLAKRCESLISNQDDELTIDVKERKDSRPQVAYLLKPLHLFAHRNEMCDMCKGYVTGAERNMTCALAACSWHFLSS
ncbi:hypothetical protein LOAG_05454 [Loa loa]|uniref:Uncharacterized protein n=1 Tax=Loa loa TaxID=7209 RepID=A0A1S0U093_LOALO|nr:hypothetical protein LOAG_05454 [Loa loa]EFO23029.1 hypothetical protein LOAG_05454 [Loa loa]